jgi:hypothetical protein
MFSPPALPVMYWGSHKNISEFFMLTAATEAIKALPEGKQLPVAIALLVHFAALSARLDEDISAGYARKQPEREEVDIAEIIKAAAEACDE